MPHSGRRPSVRDVARRAGVSAMTVSRVINGQPHISAATRAIVTQAIRDVGYSHDQVARGLRTGRTMSAGAIVPDLGNPVVATMLHAAGEALARHDYLFLVAQHGSGAGTEIAVFEQLMSRRVDGILWCIADDQDPSVARALRDCGAPVVLIERLVPGVVVDAVVADHYAAVSDAMRHLLRGGHTRVAIIPGTLRQWSARERLRAYEDSLRASSLPVPPELVLPLGSSPTVANGEEAAGRLLDAATPPTAIVVGSNRTTVGALRAIASRGLSIPEDVVIYSVSEPEPGMSEMLGRSIPAMTLPAEQMGRAAAELLLRRIGEGRSGESVTTTLPLIGSFADRGPDERVLQGGTRP